MKNRNGAKMNRVEIQERVKELHAERAQWMRSVPNPMDWNDSPQKAELEKLGEMLNECWFGECECTELQHEISQWSPVKIAVHLEKTKGNFEPLVEMQQLRATQVSDVRMRMRMLSEIRWLRGGAVRIDKAELNSWKRKAEGGDGKFVKILKRRDAVMSAKNRERMRGGVITA